MTTEYIEAFHETNYNDLFLSFIHFLYTKEILDDEEHDVIGKLFLENSDNSVFSFSSEEEIKAIIVDWINGKDKKVSNANNYIILIEAKETIYSFIDEFINDEVSAQ